MSDVKTQEARLVRYRDMERKLWGDDTVPFTGRLNDWFYAHDERLQCNIVGLRPGSGVLGDDAHRSLFGADELFYVLEGELVQSNPATGEFHIIHPGEAVFFHKDTWHHQWNYSATQLKMLEFFQPPAVTGTGSKYSASRPPFDNIPQKMQDDLLGRWPMARDEATAAQTMWVVREGDILWRMEGSRAGRQVLVGIMMSTVLATIGKMRLLPGMRSEQFLHRGDKVIVVERGTLYVEFPESKTWFELDARDGCTIPEGTPHYYHNMSGLDVEAIFCVAPDYLPGISPEAS